MFVKYNLQLEMRQNSREEKRDDSWITEKENSCLLIDASWMDAHECFDVHEGAPGKKRKRGPKNLNVK
ncbi:hypothetical protein CR513_15066, partial [Mucuna pruriens]